MTDHIGQTIAILGSGGWGTAIAILLAQRPDRDIRLWVASAQTAQLIQQHRENVRQLPGVPIPDSVKITASIEEAITDTDLWITAIPMRYLRETLERFRAYAPIPVPVLSLTKGLEIDTFRRSSEIIQEILAAKEIGVLSGPSHAEEVSRGMPTSIVVTANSPGLAEAIQREFTTDRFRLYSNPDLIGVELGGALKNVIGIAAGISDGLGYGDNAKSALVTRGLVEITRFGATLGATPSTFQGLAGMGDLITTCFSRHGRNRKLGEQLGRGESLEEIVQGSFMVVEGVGTCQSVHARATEMKIDLPITRGVHRVLFEGIKPVTAVEELMGRELRSEQELFR